MIKKIWKRTAYAISHLKIRTQFFLLIAVSLLLSFTLFECMWHNRYRVFFLLQENTSLPFAPSDDFYDRLVTEAKNYEIPDSEYNKKQAKAIEPYLELADPYTTLYIYSDEDGLFRAGRLASFFYDYDDRNPLFVSLYDLLIPDSGVHQFHTTIKFKNGYATVMTYTYHQVIFLLPWVILSLAAALLLFFLLLFFFISRKMDTAVRLEKEILRMSGGDLETPVSTFGGDEIGSLACELDHLRLALSETIRQEQESRTANQDLITAMSHDLRTPLTVLTGYLEVLRLSSDPSMRGEYVNRCLQKASDLRELTDRMFEYALVFDDRTAAQITEISSDFLYRCINENAEYLRLTGRTVIRAYDGFFNAPPYSACGLFDAPPHSASGSFDALPHSACGHFDALPHSACGSFDAPPHSASGSFADSASVCRPPLPQFSILADDTMLKRVFDNLFSNIIKYGDKKEPVEITGSLGESDLVITLKNTVKPDASNIESNRIGLKSVSRMLTQMGGDFSCTTENGTYSSKVTLRIVKQ